MTKLIASCLKLINNLEFFIQLSSKSLFKSKSYYIQLFYPKDYLKKKSIAW